MRDRATKLFQDSERRRKFLLVVLELQMHSCVGMPLLDGQSDDVITESCRVILCGNFIWANGAKRLYVCNTRMLYGKSSAEFIVDSIESLVTWNAGRRAGVTFCGVLPSQRNSHAVQFSNVKSLALNATRTENSVSIVRE